MGKVKDKQKFEYGVPIMGSNEFRDLGILQEANRQFFHPIGLAIAIALEDGVQEGKDVSEGQIFVLDSRSDPEGWIFAESEDLGPKAEAFAQFARQRYRDRYKKLGFVIQPESSTSQDEEVDE